MKYKKLFIIISAFIFVITISYGLSAAKIEAPKSSGEIPIIKNNSVNNLEKYKIINRSIVVPLDILNKKKIILLTVDDGPSKRTLEIIDILKKHNAFAIFFINGMNDKNNQGTIEQINKEGFTVGNHTWSHLNLKKEKDVNIIDNEIIKNGELINKNTGSFPRFFRAPYGESTPSIRKFVKDNGMIFMDWSGSALDWNKASREKDVFVSNVINNLHSGSIILIHEHPWSVANLDALLTKIESEGYTYVNPNNIIQE
jgi:peptidoglycan/xylan/chitin deacetylase (PgdA/CDA1 family)